MKFCSRCGKQVEDNIQFCPDCGNSFSNNVSGVNNFQFDPSVSSKSKLTAGLLQLLLTIFGVGGIGKMYMGYVGIGIAQLLVGIFTCGLGLLWPFIDGIIILCSNDVRDSEGKLMK